MVCAGVGCEASACQLKDRRNGIGGRILILGALGAEAFGQRRTHIDNQDCFAAAIVLILPPERNEERHNGGRFEAVRLAEHEMSRCRQLTVEPSDETEGP